MQQLEDTKPTESVEGNNTKGTKKTSPTTSAITNGQQDEEQPVPQPPKMKRFHGRIQLESNRISPQAGKIANEVINHLIQNINNQVEVTLKRIFRKKYRAKHSITNETKGTYVLGVKVFLVATVMPREGRASGSTTSMACNNC